MTTQVNNFKRQKPHLQKTLLQLERPFVPFMTNSLILNNLNFVLKAQCERFYSHFICVPVVTLASAINNQTTAGSHC